MLEHPWLNMPANYDYKYTDKEYEIMMLKKELKDKVKHKEKLDDSRQEMNELIESDEELNAGDIDIINPGYRAEGSEIEDFDDYDADEMSLVDSDEERI